MEQHPGARVCECVCGPVCTCEFCRGSRQSPLPSHPGGRLPGWHLLMPRGGRKTKRSPLLLRSLPIPNPQGLHDSTPTATSCHLSRVMEIEREDEWALTSPPAAVPMGRVRAPGSPTPGACTSLPAQALGSGQPPSPPPLGERESVNVRPLPPTDKAQNFLSGGISTLNLGCTFRLTVELYKNRVVQAPWNQ